jgi:flagellar motor switch/type III secretory pathway protein FliN
VTILANNMPVAKGKVTVNAGRIAVSISRLLPRPATLR